VRALIRRAEVSGAYASIARMGSEEAGAVFIKVVRPDRTCTVLEQVRRGEGDLAWMKPIGDTDEERAKAYFEKQIRFDPDLWIVEIEDREGRAFVDEPIV